MKLIRRLLICAGIAALVIFVVTYRIQTTPDVQNSPKKNTEILEATGYGSIRGKIVFDGIPPVFEPLVRKGDKSVKGAPCCGKVEIPNEKLVIGENGAIKWAVVYLRSIDQDRINPNHRVSPTDQVELTIENCQFIPHIIAMREGQTLIETSSDPNVPHNINLSGIGFPGYGKITVPSKPLKPGEKEKLGVESEIKAGKRPLNVACNIHPWMGAQVWVFNHPYFFVTDDDGVFEIDDLPVGKHQLMVWTEMFGWGSMGSGGITAQVQADEVSDLGVIRFFPGYFPRGRERWYPIYLESMSEPSLFRQRANTKVEQYRFLWLRTFHKPVAIRISMDGEDVTLRVVRLSGRGGYDPGHIDYAKSINLSIDQWNDLKESLKRLAFWEMPSSEEDEPRGRDGSRWVLEGQSQGRYHMVDRWTPKHKIESRNLHEFFACCLGLLDLSGLEVPEKEQY